MYPSLQPRIPNPRTMWQSKMPVFLNCLVFAFFLLPLCRADTVEKTYFIEEERPALTQVVNLQQEVGIPGIQFFFFNLDGNYFESDSDGIIRTKVPLDYEDKASHSMYAITTQTDTTYSITVNVIDINDNIPEFPSAVLHLDLSEATPVGAKRNLDSAKDKDEGDYNTQGYTILSGNTDSTFRLETHRGPNSDLFLDLVISHQLDRERTADYVLLIQAFDGGSPPRTGNLTLIINVLDINDNPPVFTETSFAATVNETLPVGSPILQVTALDADEGPNGQVIFEINRQRDPYEYFRIDPLTGVLSLNKPLDYESQSLHSLLIFARDNATQPERSLAFITINVLNVNENPPSIHVLFLSNDGTPKVSEAAEEGSYVARVSVNDPDEGELTNVNVTLTGGGGHFDIVTRDNIIYLVSVHEQLDREVQASYEIMIHAHDFGLPPLYSEKSITITVSDINDNAPVFDQSAYYPSIFELADIGSSVVQVRAIDADLGDNAAITYTIQHRAGTYSTWFQIDPNSGLITTKEPINREDSETVTFLVVASDSGLSPLSGNVSVVVTLRDVNDNQPRFGSSAYNVSIPENIGIGSCILTVEATDADAGDFGSVSYSIGQGYGALPPSQFFIRSDSGRICTASGLDRDGNIKQYEFPVQATDGGGLSSIALVKVIMTDVNDNIPVFYPSLYTVDIDEATDIGSDIASVTAKDRDSGEFGTVFYAIVGGNDQALFSIDRNTGTITLSGTLDRDTRAMHLLEIMATDGGGQTSDQNAEVSISVVGPDDSPPVFEQSRFNFEVQENAERLHVVGTVHAENIDPENTAVVTYSIQSGDPSGYFTLDHMTGQLSINMPPDHEQTPMLLLNVQAASGNPPTYGHTQVNITVLDINDNAPRFPSSIEVVVVPESTQESNVIFIASAHDWDSGDNGVVRYRMVENPGSIFSVQRVTGQITLLHKLSYNEQSTYEIKVEAYDRGDPVMRSDLTLIVQVQDVNDNGPQFERTMYQVTISESSPISTGIVQVVATDNDRGKNAYITYTLKQSVDAAYFAIFPDSGWVYSRHRLDYELQMEYILEVIASDKGSPPQNATAIIKVMIADDNDNVPQFTQESYHFSLPENMATNTVVGIAEATDRDGATNNRVTYTLSNSPHFTIDTTSGVVTTTRSLDREDIPSYKLTVTANDNGTPPHTATAYVYVNVEDINDNAPQFSHSDRYVVFVKEEQPVEGFVLKLVAHDLDSDLRGEILFSISRGASKFSIDPASGIISTAAILDRETHKSYTLTVVATDRGEPSMQSSIPVIVHVEDINDNTPQADNRTYLFTVIENTPPETEIGQVSAHDPDAGDNGRLYYSIIDGNSYGVFGINRTTGVIFLVNNIDYEMSANYQLTVFVEDSGSIQPQTTTIFVDINVIDLNDNAPQFMNDPVQFGIRENIPIGQVVWTVCARDTDSAENGNVRYSIQTDQWNFEIDPVSGALTTTSEIDHEAETDFLFVVQAQDQATIPEDRKTSTVTVRVFVEDENDNQPMFSSRTSTHIMEDEPIGYPVLHVVAVDGDGGESGRLVYEVASGNEDGKFVLDSLTGLLTIAHSLDHEHERHYSLNITASDHGIPQQIAYQVLDIYVEDVNDLPPQFEPIVYGMNVTENLPLATFVGQVTATDGDSGINGEISYEIPLGIADDKFTVDGTTGVIVTTAVLDREMISSYVLTVYAKDGAYPARYDVATVYIYVADDNDHSPVFATDLYTLSLPENQAPSSLHTVVAQDNDVGINAQLQYTITDGNDDSRFQLNPTTGQLSTVGPLDREEKSQYNLVIRASDSAVPSRDSTMAITITVTDQNDNDPAFEQTSYQHTIAESTGFGSSVITVHAVDQDEGANAEIQYSMDNATLGLFQIDATSGRITTAGTFDYEKETTYTFEVKATDGGAFGPRSEKVQVTIDISDENDNAPVLASIPVRANISIGTGSGAYVTTVTAEDKDSGVNGQVHFRFGETSQEFNIVEETGVILTRMAMNTDMVYRMEVIAFDMGVLSQSSTGIVEVRVGNTPSATLEFAQNDYLANVYEDAGANHQILVLHAERSDKTPAVVSYRIASGNENGAFGIQSASEDSAVLIVVDSTTLDYEADPSLRLIIEAEAPSGGPLPLYGYMTVNINLRDSNDNAPHFVQEKYTTSVWENHMAGIYVIQVSATDADAGSNSQIRYSITSGNIDSAFYLDPLTGILTTNANLDREIRDAYRLSLEAVDSGSPRLTGTAMLKISIVDTNDNRPSFPPLSAVTKSENLEVGSEVATLTAFDSDINPSITYSFAPNGNPDNQFSIDQYSGTITLAEPLDRETKDKFEVLVVASDTVHTDQTMLTVNVQDENDNIPLFDQQSYQVTLPELTPAGYAVLTVNATDLDLGLNADITYHMGVAPVQGFTIDSTSGAITTNQTIDFNPAQPVIQLVVTATDRGSPPLSSVVAVRIQITDINNNAPEFAQEIYSAFVDENALVGYIVTTVLATDLDPSHDNQKIDYRIFSGNEAGKFQITADTGDIVVVNGLDRETVPWYSLTVLASDRGTPQRNATADVVITVRDVNDHFPVFDQSEYVATVSELSTTNTTVVKVFASDNDDGRNAEVRYEIKSGNDLDMFKIYPVTGEITVRGALDHDTIPVVRISVRATDRSLVNPQNSVVTVTINVTDENDNKPYFPVMMYLERVPENKPIGTLVFTAHAIDKDTGEYGQLTYSIAEGSGQDFFVINSLTGEVTTLAKFDFESVESYRLLIRAVDQGEQSVAVQAQVEITSVDEFAPAFDKDNYKFSVAKDASVGSSIGQVHATDADKGSDGVVLYSFQYEQEYFAINNTTGIVTVKKSLSKLGRKRRDLSEALYGNRLLHRDKRSTSQNDTFSLLIKATSAKQDSLEVYISTVINVGPKAGKGGLIGSPNSVTLILVVIIPLFIFLLLILIILIFVIKRRRNQNPPVERKPDRSLSPPSYDGAFDPVEMGPHAMVNHGLSMTPDQHLMYSQNMLYRLPPGANSSMEVGHLTRTDVSDNSASSGRGSTTVEDEEIRKINERTVSPDEKSQRAKAIDSGILQDHDDGISFRETETDFMNSHGKESLAEMIKQSASVESMHVFGDEGGGEAGGGVDIGNLIYAKLDEVGAEEDDAIMDGTRAFGFADEGHPSMGGSLSSIVNSDEELSGSYNWDYLLDWGPQFHPLAHVFEEIALLKDDTIARRNLDHHRPKNAIQPKPKMHPPPLLTNRPQGPIKPVAPVAMNTSNASKYHALPRSPITNESAFSPMAASPDLTPDLSPLIPGSPSIHGTPQATTINGYSSIHSNNSRRDSGSSSHSSYKGPRGIILPSFGSEKEIQI